MNEKVINYIKEYNMMSTNESVVVGVSGGSDSMCLINILLKLRTKYLLELHVVHIHHGLRGIEADEDMAFVEKFCNENDIDFTGVKYDVKKIAKDKGMSTEETGRMLRYDTFFDIANKYSAKIAIAHNMEDLAETVLFNLFRGSAIKGLSGISPVRDNIIRPIMCLSKDEIYAYLKENNISYRTDKTNFEDEYTRNKIRLNVLPYVKENINPKATEHIFATAKMIAQTDEYILNEANMLYERFVWVLDSDNSIMLVDELFTKPHILLTYVVRIAIMKLTNSLKDISSTHVESVIELFTMKSGSRVDLPYSIYGIKEYKGIKLSCKKDKEIINEIEIKDFGNYDIPWKKSKLCISKSEFTTDIFRDNLYTKWINYDILEDNLSVRTRQSGDYIVIDESGSTKKLNRYFVDEKIPKDIRDSIVIVANGSRVLWIVGYRIAADVKVGKDSKHIIRLDYFVDGGQRWAKR